MESDPPVAIDLNVDAALLLKDMAGIDSYPSVLALLPNVYRVEDRDRVHAVVAADLAEVGIIDGDRVHPEVEHWLHCLYRPDIELAMRVLDTGLGGEPQGMLRLSLVRCQDTHVLAVRADDAVVIQSVFQERHGIESVTAAVSAALGQAPILRFKPVTAPLAEFATIAADPDERRYALMQLGAAAHTAGVLSRVFEEVVRRAEIVLIEHRDGGSSETEVCVSVLDTLSGRLIVTPGRAVDGEIWSTYAPGDDSALHAAIGALIELLPGRSWFDTSRIQ